MKQGVWPGDQMYKLAVVAVALSVFLGLETYYIGARPGVEEMVDHLFVYFKDWNIWCTEHPLVVDFLLLADTLYLVVCVLITQGNHNSGANIQLVTS